MSRVLFGVAAAALMTASFAFAQSVPTPKGQGASATNPPKPGSGRKLRELKQRDSPPTTVEACLAMLKDIGPNIRAAKFSPSELAELQAKGAAAASLCHQQKFKEAHDAHTNIITATKAKGK
jgi:hypothetical protein